jgi:hypothetical protein
MKPVLTIDLLCKEANTFAVEESVYPEPSLYGTTDGTAVGTYLEHKFQAHLALAYTFAAGNSAKGIDFPELGVDIKVTSVEQPQSSSPFKSARQKIFGLGYNLLVFVYAKKDDSRIRCAVLDLLHVIFINKAQTADYQMTSGLLRIIKNNGNTDDLVAFMNENKDKKTALAGFTDNIGTEAYNLKLSDRRVNSVRDYVVKKGVDSGRISGQGFGESKPIADNKTAAGRVKNRRVEIKVN